MSEALKMDPAPFLISSVRPQEHNKLTDINEILACYHPIALDEITRASLMDRRERKYLINLDQATEIIRTLAGEYHALEIEGGRIGAYETLYFDTDEFTIYLQHHNGRKNRYKLRARRYASTNVSFLEVKQKLNKGRTKKFRIETDHLVTQIESSLSGFLAGCFPYDPGTFHSLLMNTYQRITLVAPDFSERITIDLDLRYTHEDHAVTLPNVAIVELKTSQQLARSPFSHLMHQMHIRPTSFSKYCIGVSILFPGIKKNRFKEKILQIKRIINQEIQYAF